MKPNSNLLCRVWIWLTTHTENSNDYFHLPTSLPPAHSPNPCQEPLDHSSASPFLHPSPPPWQPLRDAFQLQEAQTLGLLRKPIPLSAQTCPGAGQAICWGRRELEAWPPAGAEGNVFKLGNAFSHRHCSRWRRSSPVPLELYFSDVFFSFSP